MTCKDCLYYKVRIIPCTPSTCECNNFFNCSHLPYKVGNTIYKLGYVPCHLGVTSPDSYACEGCLDECDIKKAVTEYKIPSLSFIVNEIMHDESSYYITREEAEKALLKGN